MSGIGTALMFAGDGNAYARREMSPFNRHSFLHMVFLMCVAIIAAFIFAVPARPAVALSALDQSHAVERQAQSLDSQPSTLS